MVKDGLAAVTHLVNYHVLDCFDTKMGLFGSGDIQKYISGTALKGAGGEEAALMAWIARNNKTSAVKKTFNIVGEERVDAYEPFYRAGIRRAFAGRASPAEYRDVVRLAFLAGRFKFPVDAPSYAQTWFGQDCNAFVGNYLGLSPNVAIFAYACGYGTGTPPGASADVLAVRHLLPMQPVTDPVAVRAGNVLISYCSSKEHAPFAHIAVVSSFTLAADRKSGTIGLVEWGTKGGIERHCTVPKTVKLIENWLCPHMPKAKKLICFQSDGDPANKIPPSKRIFFEQSGYDNLDMRGFGILGNDEL